MEPLTNSLTSSHTFIKELNCKQNVLSLTVWDLCYSHVIILYCVFFAALRNILKYTD